MEEGDGGEDKQRQERRNKTSHPAQEITETPARSNCVPNSAVLSTLASGHPLPLLLCAHFSSCLPASLLTLLSALQSTAWSNRSAKGAASGFTLPLLLPAPPLSCCPPSSPSPLSSLRPNALDITMEAAHRKDDRLALARSEGSVWLKRRVIVRRQSCTWQAERENKGKQQTHCLICNKTSVPRHSVSYSPPVCSHVTESPVSVFLSSHAAPHLQPLASTSLWP